MNYFNDRERLIENIKKLKCYKLFEVEEMKLQMKSYPQLLKEYKKLWNNQLKVINDIKSKYYEFSLTFSNKDGSIRSIVFDKTSTNCHTGNRYNLPFSLSTFQINEKLNDSEQIKLSSQLMYIYNLLLNDHRTYHSIKDKVRDSESKYFIIPRITNYYCDNEKINDFINIVDIVPQIDIYFHYQDIKNNCNRDIKNFRLINNENLNDMLKYNFNSIVLVLKEDWKSWIEEEKGNLHIQYEFPNEYNIINKKSEIVIPLIFK